MSVIGSSPPPSPRESSGFFDAASVSDADSTSARCSSRALLTSRLTTQIGPLPGKLSPASLLYCVAFSCCATILVTVAWRFGSTPSTPPTPAPTPAPIGLKAVVWNTFYKNLNYNAIADVLIATDADIIGIDEFTGDYDKLMPLLQNRSTNRSLEVQPGVSGWQGYGTDIIFDSKLWEALEGGKDKVACPGTQRGDRAANWVVLRHRASHETLITGGIHLSYCAKKNCDGTQECELGKLYDKLEEMKSKYNCSVFWMGDMNHCDSDHVVNETVQGHLGKRSVFRMTRMSKDVGPTVADEWYKGCAIDHIFAEGSDFHRITSGTAVKYKYQKWVGGSDHYPVFASLQFTR